MALALKEAHKQKNSVVVISSNITSLQGREILDAAEFAELLKDVLLDDMVQHPAEQFRCIFVAVQSLQQCETYNRCFEKWSTKNNASATAQVASTEMPAAMAASAAATKVDEHEEASGRLVLLKQPQIDEVTLEKWLRLPILDDESSEAWMAPEAEGPELPWEECPEAVMNHSLELSDSILQ